MIRLLLTTGLVLFAASGPCQPPASRNARPGSPETLCWDRDALPILRRSCLGCHGPGSAMGSLADFDSARLRSDKIRQNLESRRMPMRGELRDETRAALIAWAAQGAPACP